MSASDWDGILRDGEAVIWQGKPDGGVFLEASRRKAFYAGAFSFVVGVMMSGVALSKWDSQKDASDWGFALSSIALLGISGYLGLSQLLLPAYKRRHTFYSLTNQRAILGVQFPGKARIIETYDISPDKTYEYRPATPGAPGSIVFDHQYTGVQVNDVPQRFAMGFMYIYGAEAVWQKLQKVQRDMIKTRAERGAHG